MIEARWADVNDYLSNLREKWDESKMCETKKRFDYHFRKWLSNFCPLSPLFPLSPFCPPLSPTTPITPYNPPNIFRAPPFPPRVFSASAGVICASTRVDGAGCAMIVQKWINNSYAKLQAGYFHLQPSISKATLLASMADRRRELTWGLDWWMGYDYSRHGGLTSFCCWLNMYKCCIYVWEADYRLKATDKQEQFSLLVKNIEVFSLRLFPVEWYELNEIS